MKNSDERTIDCKMKISSFFDFEQIAKNVIKMNNRGITENLLIKQINTPNAASKSSLDFLFV